MFLLYLLSRYSFESLYSFPHVPSLSTTYGNFKNVVLSTKKAGNTEYISLTIPFQGPLKLLSIVVVASVLGWERFEFGWVDLKAVFGTNKNCQAKKPGN